MSMTETQQRNLYNALEFLVSSTRDLKKAWIEFLGEKPDPVTERVE